MKIPREIKRVIKIMKPDEYEVEYGQIYTYCIYLFYNNVKLNTISSDSIEKMEEMCEQICKNSDVVFFIEEL